MKRFLMTAAKLLVAFGLLLWLSLSDKLDFKQLRIFIDDPVVLLLNMAVWGLGYVVLGTLRWFLLMKGMKLIVRYWRAMQLQLIGFFFNTAIPGAVGGDIVKAVYIIREQQEQVKTPALVSVLLDRIIGLVALIMMAAVAIMMRYDAVMSEPRLKPLAIFSFVTLAAIVLGIACVFFPFAPTRDPFVRLFSLRLPAFQTLGKIYGALRSYRDKPSILVACLGISVVIQSLALLYTWWTARVLTGQEIDLGTFAVIFPLGTVSTAIPLAPGGLGVGHAAFDALFSIVGWHGGANVFNVTSLGALALHLTGVIPYLWFRARRPLGESDYVKLLEDSTKPAKTR